MRLPRIAVATRKATLRVALGVVVLVLLALSCSPPRASAPRLDPTPPLSGGPGWAVVKGAYVRLKDSPSSAGRDLSHLRRGEVLEIAGRELDPSADGRLLWYKLVAEAGPGWVLGVDLDVFSTRAQAERTAAAYR